jgi:hypothetical protein
MGSRPMPNGRSSRFKDGVRTHAKQEIAPIKEGPDPFKQEIAPVKEGPDHAKREIAPIKEGPDPFKREIAPIGRVQTHAKREIESIEEGGLASEPRMGPGQTPSRALAYGVSWAR